MNTVSTKHLIFLISALGIASINTYSSLYIKLGGRDSWIAMLIASIIILLISFYIIAAMKKSQCYDIREIHNRAYGKTLGGFVMLLYGAMLLLSAIESAAVEANAISTNVFLETPQWYLLIFFIVPAIYPITKGYMPIFLTTILTMLTIYISEAIIISMSVKYNHYSYLQPVLANGFNRGLIEATLEILGLYGSIFIILPYLSKILNKKALKSHFTIGLIITIAISLISVITLISSFGPERASNLFYPRLLQTQRINFGGFIEFGEVFVILQIVSNWFIKYIITFYAIVLLYGSFFTKNKYALYVLSIIIFIGAYFAANNTIILFTLLRYFSYISIVGFIVIPIITFSLLAIRGRKSV